MTITQLAQKHNLEPESAKAFLQDDDLAWLIRFKETAEDDNSYDTPKNALKRLIEIGVVRSVGFGRCTTTSFGDWILECYFEQNPSLPLIARPTDLGD